MEKWIERRKKKRTASYTEATLVHTSGLVRHPATIVEVSPLGALIELPDQTELPESFDLLFSNVIQPCRLVWTKGHYVGVRFMQP
jgi:phage tail protein X